MGKQKPKIYQLKVTLRGCNPSVWRRLLVPGDLSLLKLHLVMQIAMGWEDAHVHRFVVGNTYYSIPIEDFFESDKNFENSEKVKLSQLVTGEGFEFSYEYDLGDNWEHQIVVEKIVSPDASVFVPRCVEGVGACPPEDIGGIFGYAVFVTAMQDPQHPDHASYQEWLMDVFGVDTFDPAAFDLETVNEMLHTLVAE
jgi:hypothetical protein